MLHQQKQQTMSSYLALKDWIWANLMIQNYDSNWVVNDRIQASNRFDQ